MHGPTCKRILTDCARHATPKLGRLASAEQVRQLALAIDPTRLLVIIAVKDAPAERLRLRSLAQGAEWLAANTKSRVILVLPLALRALSELDHVTYASCVFADQTDVDEDSRAKTGVVGDTPSERGLGKANAEPRVSLSPIIGKPHSEVERILYDRLTGDPELRPLFAYNQPVATCNHERPIVDLLWNAGKLVIEVDGDNHRGQWQFAVDRVRDYWLLMSGYRVMRFTNSRIIEQGDEVVSMIRNAVRYIGNRESAQ